MARIKKQSHEKLDDVNIKHVIQLLEQKKPITKKAACEILNISYNTARLKKIIDQFKEDHEWRLKRQEALRGKPFDDAEIRYTVLNYLKGDSIASLARTQFRTVGGVNKVLEYYGIPKRNSKNTYWNPSIIPDEAISEIFEDNELVWSARYNCMCQVKELAEISKEHGNIYWIWVYGKHNMNAAQAAYDLGKLPIIKKLNITSEDFNTFDTKGLFYSIRD